MRLGGLLKGLGGGVAIVGAYLAPLAAADLPVPAGGFRSLDDAVAHCRDSGLTGQELVDLARDTVRAQFVSYSSMSPWETPRQAFARRRGYSAQYNAALVEMLGALGFEAETVYCPRIQDLAERPWWRSGHVWARVRLDGRQRDVDAGLVDEQGRLTFVPEAHVVVFGPRTRRNTAILLTLTAAWQRWQHLLTGEPLPRWVERPFTETA